MANVDMSSFSGISYYGLGQPQSLNPIDRLFCAFKGQSDSECESIIKGLDQDTLFAAAEDGSTALHLATEKKNETIITLLLDKCPRLVDSIDKKGRTALHIAVANKDQVSFSQLLNKMYSSEIILATYSDGYTVLHLAVLNNQIDMIKSLLSRSPHLVSIADRFGQTPLHWAASKGLLDACQEIISAMKGIHKESDIGLRTFETMYTPLHLAIHGAHEEGAFLEVIKLLVETFPQVIRYIDAYGQTPLHWAASKQLPEICKVLLEKMTPEDIAVQTYDRRQTALHFAVQCGAQAINEIRLLMDKLSGRPDLIGKTDNNGWTILHWAAINDDTELILSLLEEPVVRSTCINVTDIHGQTPLHWMASKGNAGACTAFYKCEELTWETVSKQMNGRQQTALHFAVQGGYGDVINVLLSDSDAEGERSSWPARLVKIRDAYNQSALDWAKGRSIDDDTIKLIERKLREEHTELL